MTAVWGLQGEGPREQAAGTQLAADKSELLGVTARLPLTVTGYRHPATKLGGISQRSVGAKPSSKGQEQHTGTQEPPAPAVPLTQPLPAGFPWLVPTFPQGA